MERIHPAPSLLIVAALAASPARAIPTNPDPLHTAAATPWSSVLIGALNPATDQHQHYSTDDLFHSPGKFATYAVWDDNAYRYDAANDAPLADYGHGYMQNAATYRFAASVPAAAKALFNSNVVGYWEGAINGPRVNATGASVDTRITFDEIAAGGDMVIVFDSKYPTGGAGNIVDEDFPSPGEIEPDGTRPGGDPGAGRNRVLAFWTPSIRQLTFNSLINWYYLDPIVGPAVGQFDFVTTALHEFGHVLGLDHEGPMASVMFPRQASYVAGPLPGQVVPFDVTAENRALDVGTRDGSIALYTIAVPEPTSLALLAIGLLASAARALGPRKGCSS